MRRNKKAEELESISLQENIRITSQAREKNPYKYYLTQLLMMWIGIFTPMYCFISSFDLSYDSDVFIIASLITALIYWMLFYYYKYLLITFPIVILCYVFLFSEYKQLFENGFYYIENAVIEKLNSYLDLSIVGYKTNFEEEVCITILLIGVIQLLAFTLAVQVVREIRKDIYICLSLVLVASGFFVGIIPNTYSLFAYIIYLFMLVSMGSVPFKRRLRKKRNPNDKRTTLEYKQLLRLKVAVIVGIILSSLVLFLSLIFTKNDYNTYIDISDTKNRLQTTLMEFSIEDAVENLSKRLEKINPFSGEGKFFTDTSTVSGGLSGGKLSVTGNVTFTNATALKLTMPKASASLYLKGFAGATYAGDAWEGLNKEEEKEYKRIVDEYGNGTFTGDSLTNAYLDLFLDGAIELSESRAVSFTDYSLLRKFELDVDYVNANKAFMYAPYFFDSSELSNVESINDLFLKPQKKKSTHNFTYYSLQRENDVIENLIRLREINSELKVKDEEAYRKFEAFEKEYRKFVYETYVGIPEGEFLGIEGANLNIPKAYDVESMIHIVERIREYLSTNTKYTLSPGDLPEGKDFIEYFLFENKKGYCAHYASSAVMLLRYYGVPARYIEGYIVTEEDINYGRVGQETNYSSYNVYFQETIENTKEVTVEIKDTNAHSWVEVYLDGVGWIPLEFTAGYSEEGIGFINENIERRISGIPTTTPLPTNTPVPTSTPTPSVPTNSPTPTEILPSISQAPPSEEQNNNNLETEGMKKEDGIDGKLKQIMNTFLRIVVCIIVLVAIIMSRYLFITYFRDKRIYDKTDRNAAAIAIYKEMERILSILRFQKMESETYEQFFDRVFQEYDYMGDNYLRVMDYVLKARFSDEVLKKDELNVILSFYLEFRRKLYGQWQLLRKFYMKYWKVL